MPKPVRKMQKANAAAQARVLPKIPPELLDQLVKGPMSAQAVHEASQAFKKALIERALGAEMSHHLGYPAGADKPEAATNHRNGRSGKTVLTEDGPGRFGSRCRETGRVRSNPSSSASTRGGVGPQIPYGGGVLAPRLVAGDSVLCVCAGDPQGDLHHQRDR